MPRASAAIVKERSRRVLPPVSVHVRCGLVVLSMQGAAPRTPLPEAREVGSALGMPLECTAITMVILAWGWSILVVGLERGVIVMSLDQNAIPMVRLAWG